MFDPANDMRWTGGIASSRPAQPGTLVKGARVERSAKFLGRTFDYEYAVTAHKQDEMVELKVDRPFPMVIRYELEDAPAGTLVAIHASGTPGRFFGWASPLMTRQVRKSIAGDLDRLRGCLEASARSAVIAPRTSPPRLSPVLHHWTAKLPTLSLTGSAARRSRTDRSG